MPSVISDVSPNGLSARQLTDDYAAPSYSPDGRRIALSAIGTATMDADGGSLVTVYRGPGWDPQFSRDGRRIIVSRGYAQRMVSFDAGNGRNRRSFPGVRGWSPTFSASGVLAFTRLVNNPPRDSCGELIGSEPELSDIYTARPGRKIRRVTRTYGASNPDWSPDGSKIVFERDPNLSRADSVGGPPVPPVDVDECLKPVPRQLSPARASRPVEAWIVNSNGRRLHRLARNARDPVWSPDGRYIAFLRDAYSARGRIVVVRVDGTQPRRVVGGNPRNPSWQPQP